MSFEDLVCNGDYQIKKFCSYIKVLLDIEPITECQLHRTGFLFENMMHLEFGTKVYS